MSSQTESQVRQRLVGTWNLVSTEETLRDGSSRPFQRFGAQCKGFLMYQADGYMCAILAAAADGTFAYCGRYEIDASRNLIVHLPDVATDPGYVGSRQIRPYHFDGDRLILSDVEKNDPIVARWTIVWEKVR